MPIVSVILTSFNHAKYICESIDSVLNQTFTDFELIILDDASSDNSWELINKYTDPRIRAFRSERGAESVFKVNNIISRVAEGEYIAVQHSDDVWAFDKLEKQLAFLKAHPETGAVFTNAIAIGEDSAPLADRQHFYSDIFDQPNRTRHEWLRFFFSRGNALCHPSVLIRKVCYEKCGLYRYGLNQADDFDMWIRLCLKYEIQVLPEKLVRFRVRDNEANVSGNRPEVRARVYFEYYHLLFNYLNIDSFDELCQVFPQSKKYDRGGDSIVPFALAMTVLDLKLSNFSAFFALNVLFDLISDPDSNQRLFDVYGFDHGQFNLLTGEHDPFQVLHIENLAKIAVERAAVVAGLERVASDRDNEIHAYQAQAEEFARHVSALQTSLKLAAGEIERRDNDLHAYHAQAEEFARHVSALQTNLKLAAGEIERRDNEIHAYQAQAEEFARHVSALQTNLKLAAGEIERRDNDLHAYHAQAEEFARHVSALQTNLKLAAGEIERRDNDLHAYHAQAEEFARHVSALQTNLKLAAGEIERRDNDLHAYHAQAEEFARHVSALQANLKIADTEVARLASNLNQTQAQRKFELSSWKFLGKQMLALSLNMVRPTNKNASNE